MLRLRSAPNHNAALGSISGMTSGGKLVRSQTASAPQMSKHTAVNWVKPRLTSPRKWTQKSAMMPPTAASSSRKYAARGRALTTLRMTQSFGFVGSRVIVFEAQGVADFGRRGLENGGVLVGGGAQAVALANSDVIAHAGLHSDVVQLAVRALQHQDA